MAVDIRFEKYSVFIVQTDLTYFPQYLSLFSDHIFQTIIALMVVVISVLIV